MKKIFLLLVFIGIFVLQARAEEITVAAASSLQFTLEEIKSVFEAKTGVTVNAVTGASGKLSAQIINGAPFDVFMSADIELPKKLYRDGFAISAPKVYAMGVLVLWTLRDIDLTQGLRVLRRNDIIKVAIASPNSAPYGKQAFNALKYQQFYDLIEPKLVYGESIAQVNQFITTKAADIGFTAKSVVLSLNMQDIGKWVEVDAAAYETIAQAVVILKNAKEREISAQRFVDFLFSAQAREIFKKYGYKLP